MLGIRMKFARHFAVQNCTAERLVRRMRETGRVSDRPRSGRPRVTSRQDRSKGDHLEFSHLTELKTIYITEIYMKTQYKSSINQ